MVKVMYNEKLVYKVVISVFWGVILWKEKEALNLKWYVLFMSLYFWYSRWRPVPHVIPLMTYCFYFSFTPAWHPRDDTLPHHNMWLYINDILFWISPVLCECVDQPSVVCLCVCVCVCVCVCAMETGVTHNWHMIQW